MTFRERFAVELSGLIALSFMAKKKDRDQMTWVFFHGWDGGIRTPECWYQKPVPYHLATSH